MQPQDKYKNSAAFYDVDGTLIKINIVHTFAYYASRHASLATSARNTIKASVGGSLSAAILIFHAFARGSAATSFIARVKFVFVFVEAGLADGGFVDVVVDDAGLVDVDEDGEQEEAEEESAVKLVFVAMPPWLELLL